MPKLYISTTQGMMLYLHHTCVFRRCLRTSGSASRNAKSTLPVIMCVSAFSPLELLPSFRSHTPAQISSSLVTQFVPQKAFSKASMDGLNYTNVTTCEESN
ncbi:TPA: hypothetical protein ACH3X2_010823 [Trebouxia sp. C0005]